jgi:hypothetical protein
MSLTASSGFNSTAQPIIEIKKVVPEHPDEEVKAEEEHAELPKQVET